MKYLCQSKEIQIFLRPGEGGDLEAQFKRLYKPKTQEMLATFRATLGMSEVM
jgi:hypothetical protein